MTLKYSIRKIQSSRNGVALIVCMAFLAIFTALAVGMIGMADTNMQLARNQHSGSLAFTGAQSGLEVMRYWLAKVDIDGSVTPTHRLQAVASGINGMSGVNISAVYDGLAQTVTIQPVTLDTSTGQQFSAVLSGFNSNSQMQAKIIGSCGQASKQVVVDYNFVSNGNGVFNYGVATKGPLNMSGQAEIEGETEDLNIDASVYIEGDNTASDAFSSTVQANVAGDVSVANPYATVTVNGEVGGVQGGDGHVHIGVPYVDFPTPNPQHFLSYATGPEITSGIKNDTVVSNAIIRAGSNVTFSSDIVINGILYIESPANVNFTGKATINGIIAGDGALDNVNSSLKFAGQVISHDASTLAGTQYDAIKKETGTFIVAPGFSLEFSGQSLYMNGAIAASGVKLSGQALGTINGSLINYSSTPMTMSGKSTLKFNRSGRDKVPAGFEPDQKLIFITNSYSESL